MHGPLLTLDEVLQRLRLSRRWMQDFLKHHEDCYLKAGNRYRFTEQHVQSLMERMACQIGRASCRARVCQYVSISVVDVSLKKKKNKEHAIVKSEKEKKSEA